MRLSLLVTACALFAQPLMATTSNVLTYCATDRTGDSSAHYYEWQSNGWCEAECKAYDFGIVQGYNCWCSDVAPGDTVKLSKCDYSCPGYPQDNCGNASLGLYGYIGIYAKGSVTTTADLTTSSSTSTSSTSTSTSPTQTSTKTTPTITTSDVTTSAKSSVALETNASGQVKTVTVPASTATSGLEISGDSTTGKKGLSGGSIAGIVIGVLGGLALLGALIFMVFFYRRRARTSSPVPSQDMADRTSQGSSFSHGVFAQGPTSLARKGTFTDNRLKTTIYPNGPRDSSVSLQDNEDYSRPVLRLTNPD